MPALGNGNIDPLNRPELYWFRTKEGTDLSTFEAYIRTLPDNGSGDKIVFPLVPWQSYMTSLTPAQAQEVGKQPFIKFVCPVTGYDSGSYVVLHDRASRILVANLVCEDSLTAMRASDYLC